jgi:hypothetical protein
MFSVAFGSGLELSLDKLRFMMKLSCFALVRAPERAWTNVATENAHPCLRYS